MDEKLDISLLELILRQEGVPESAYSIGEYSEEALCIEQVGDQWLVYFGEHGMVHNAEAFEDEALACESFLRRINDYV